MGPLSRTGRELRSGWAWRCCTIEFCRTLVPCLVARQQLLVDDGQAVLIAKSG